eukprot:TRINITY_DN34073_c0_g1_i1.p2 TRINITY_DN34073_c0_g1~~TRINITY_DN34073_c0_g1_i1.p2  ORF type:complete len:260 (-),score=15.00 TRINITY_DN34073_c0_g1_i1:101-880(-)
MNQLANQIDELQRILRTRIKNLVLLSETVQDLKLSIVNVQKKLHNILTQNMQLNEVLWKTDKTNCNQVQFQKLELLEQTKTELICWEQQQQSKKSQLTTLVEKQSFLATQDTQILDEYYQKEKTQAQQKLQNLQDFLKTLGQQKVYTGKIREDTTVCQQQIDNLNNQKRNQVCLIAQMHLDTLKTKNQIEELEILCSNQGGMLESLYQERQAEYSTQQSRKERIYTLQDHNARLQTERSVLVKQLEATKQHLGLLDSKL